MYKRINYDFKEDLKSGFIAVFWITMIVLLFYCAMALLDYIDQYTVEAHVIRNLPYDNQIVTFEDESGYIWTEYFDYEREVHCGDKAILTIKENENMNVEDDIVVDVEWVE